MFALPSSPHIFENLAYYFARTSGSLTYRLLKKVLLGQRETRELVSLCIATVKNLRQVGILTDKDLDTVFNFLLDSLVERKNPVEVMKFLLITVNQALARLKEEEGDALRELLDYIRKHGEEVREVEAHER